jgi:hypothetical protein
MKDALVEFARYRGRLEGYGERFQSDRRRTDRAQPARRALAGRGSARLSLPHRRQSPLQRPHVGRAGTGARSRPLIGSALAGHT